MTVYAIYDPKPSRPDLPRAVPEQFSWLAAILPPVYFVRHGLWLILIAYMVKVAGLIVLGSFLGTGVGFVLYLLLAIWLGLSAPGLRRFGLEMAGWLFRGDRIALSADLARVEAMQ